MSGQVSAHDSAHDHVSDNSSVQPSVQVINLINSIDSNELSIEEILEVYKLVYKSRWYFKKHTILPAKILLNSLSCSKKTTHLCGIFAARC